MLATTASLLDGILTDDGCGIHNLGEPIIIQLLLPPGKNLLQGIKQ